MDSGIKLCFPNKNQLMIQSTWQTPIELCIKKIELSLIFESMYAVEKNPVVYPSSIDRFIHICRCSLT